MLRGEETFDFGQSDGNGVVTFDNVPVGGNYTVRDLAGVRAQRNDLRRVRPRYFELLRTIYNERNPHAPIGDDFEDLGEDE
ncbi:MAG: hypothetical protein QOC81_4134 [Thermoanaerobaculia bacterium]|nr:hypothetical protein [Thermoanaerobaculia bacterium]